MTNFRCKASLFKAFSRLKVTENGGSDVWNFTNNGLSNCAQIWGNKFCDYLEIINQQVQCLWDEPLAEVWGEMITEGSCWPVRDGIKSLQSERVRFTVTISVQFSHHATHVLPMLRFLVHVELVNAVGLCRFVLELRPKGLSSALTIWTTVGAWSTHHSHLRKKKNFIKNENELVYQSWQNLIHHPRQNHKASKMIWQNWEC